MSAALVAEPTSAPTETLPSLHDYVESSGFSSLLV